jgi:hypothetical protein
MSDDHFTVDGTLIQAWASHKSFRSKDGSDDDGANIHGQKRSNETHESTNDPDARLYKKSYGKESHLAYLGHALMENRNGLIAAAMVTVVCLSRSFLSLWAFRGSRSALTGNQNADYFPYGYAYGTNGVYLLTHAGYSNYNSLQVSWVKRSTHLSFNLNYTSSKTLGTDMNEDPFTLHDNYGPETTDRPNVINTSFSYNDLKMYHGDNRIFSGMVNNWMISATTTYQSGGNLQALDNPNFSFSDSYTGTLPAGVGTPLTAATYFGTTAGISIQPTLTCNPSSGRGSDQFLTDKCFAVPTIGTNGPRNYPYIKGVAYFDSDLALAKSFHITQNHTVTFRASAFDWLNHPLNAFSGNQLNH